mmetsp:Transcript_18368/g.21150  ORF Transcript_18368/g.21150 Transcript_18368/m.21150 type:complete len:162 (+) Transcript_18368:115-600(+)
MLRRTIPTLENTREFYHRVHLPRRIALQRHIRAEERKLAKRRGEASSSATSSAATPAASSSQVIPYKYNRWWVSNDHAFVHQYAVVEDPEVTRERREKLPMPTAENTWKEPQSPFFLPFAPFIRVVDYPKDADAKFLKPVNIPRWKDYMNRAKPVVPRTWY